MHSAKRRPPSVASPSLDDKIRIDVCRSPQYRRPYDLTKEESCVARVGLGLSKSDLADLSGISLHTLVCFETGCTPVSIATRRAIQKALEQCGVVFNEGERAYQLRQVPVATTSITTNTIRRWHGWTVVTRRVDRAPSHVSAIAQSVWLQSSEPPARRVLSPALDCLHWSKTEFSNALSTLVRIRRDRPSGVTAG